MDGTRSVEKRLLRRGKEARLTQSWDLEHSRSAGLTPERTASPEPLGQVGKFILALSALNPYSVLVKNKAHTGEVLANIC